MDTKHDFIPKCMKLSVFFINALYWVLGISAIGLGLYLLPIQELISVQFGPAFRLIMMGILLIVAAIFGFVGTMRENISFLRWYLVILLFLLMVYMAMGVVACIWLFSPPLVPINVEDTLKTALISYKDDSHSADFINKIQTQLQCCGVGHDGYKDWMVNPYFSCTDDNFSAERCSVPPSCCRFDSLETIDTTCGFGATNEEFISKLEVSSIINTQGCLPKAQEMIESAAALLGFSAFGIAITLLCGVLLSSRMLSILEFQVSEYWRRCFVENNVIHLKKAKQDF